MCVPVLSALIVLMPLQVQQGQRTENPPAVIRATGIGKPPHGKPTAQSRLMARRAAEVVAIRNLAARVHGLTADPTEGTSRITTVTQISGFRHVSSRSLPGGRVEVTVELPIARFGAGEGLYGVGRAAVQTRLARIRTQLEAVAAHVKSVERRIEARIAEIERELSASWRAFRGESLAERSPGWTGRRVTEPGFPAASGTNAPGSGRRSCRGSHHRPP